MTMRSIIVVQCCLYIITRSKLIKQWAHTIYRKHIEMQFPCIHFRKQMPFGWGSHYRMNMVSPLVEEAVLEVMNTNVGQPILLISLLMVPMYLNIGLPLGITPSTSMHNTVLFIWLSFLCCTCPYHRSRFCIRRVVIGWTVAAFLISSYLMWSLGLTHCPKPNSVMSVLFTSFPSPLFIVLQYIIVGYITVLWM